MAKLTYGERKALPASAFPEEKSKVRATVKKKYQGIGQGGERTMVSPEGVQGPKMRRYGNRHAKR